MSVKMKFGVILLSTLILLMLTLNKCKEVSSQNQISKEIKLKIIEKKALSIFNNDTEKVNSINAFKTAGYRKVNFDKISFGYIEYKKRFCIYEDCLEKFKSYNYMKSILTTAFLVEEDTGIYTLRTSGNIIDRVKSQAISLELGKLSFEKKKYINMYCDGIIICKVSVIGRITDIIYDGYYTLGLEVDDIYFFKKEKLNEFEVMNFENRFFFEKNNK